MLEKTKELYVKEIFDQLSNDELDEWVNISIENSIDYNGEIYDLVSIDSTLKKKRFKEIVEKYETIDYADGSYLVIMKEMALHLYDRYKSKEITPMVLSKFINTADPFIYDNNYAYPDWLGNLWNCLDWCDEKWTHDSAPQVEDEIDRIVKAIKSGRDKCKNMESA